MRKKVARNNKNALVAGVVSGLADYFEQDPILFRLIAVAMLILTGVFPGLLLYLIAWIMMPRSERPRADYTIDS